MPRAYLGLSVPGFPNLFLLYGPNTNGGTGSVIYTIEAGMGHVIAALDELERADARRIEVRREAADAFDASCARARGNGLAHRLHELVRRRERQRPEPVAVDLYELPPANGPSRSSGIRDRRPAKSFRNQRGRLTDLETRRGCPRWAGWSTVPPWRAFPTQRSTRGRL